MPATQLGGGSVVIHSSGRALQTDSFAAAGAGALLTPDALYPAVTHAVNAWALAGADADQLDAIGLVPKTHLGVNPVVPDVDVAFAGQVTPEPLFVLAGPLHFETHEHISA